MANLKTPPEVLCFDKMEFMKANFSVDEFLHKNRNAPSLEQLRDNLGIYLKGLRASMIDLINEDYADFVSLSANLVGLNHSINTIRQPLKGFQNEISSIQSLITENESEICDNLKRKQNLLQLKRNLKSLQKVYNSEKTLEYLLANQLADNPYSINVERAALELIQLRFNEKFCVQYLNDSQKENIQRLHQNVLDKLRINFNKALQTSSSVDCESLERCLRVYITLDSCRVAETAFAEDIVAPYMNNIISEHSLQNSPQGLSGIYIKILNFISLHMTDLLRLTLYSDKFPGFNFIVNSFWCEVAMRLETHMSSVFAPGNAEVFYEKYKCTLDFLGKIEQLLPNEKAIKDFRQKRETKSFTSRWNLPVYFQICIQDIAGQFEGLLSPILANVNFSRDKSQADLHLQPFIAAFSATQRCWADGTYLSDLFPKFFKLNIQIILRLFRWIEDVIRLVNGSTKQTLPYNINSMELSVALHSDLRVFFNQKMPTIQQTILSAIDKDKRRDAINSAVRKSFSNLNEIYQRNLSRIRSSIVQLVMNECGTDTVRQVHDLPRLYRKTNREVPTRCSSYMEHLLRPLKSFHDDRKTHLGQDEVDNILTEVTTLITAEYFSAVSDVLTSVQKTEESLRRLRNIKGGALSASSIPQGISDDDKIRLQLRVDVQTWTSELSGMISKPSEIKHLSDLNDIVEQSIKPKDLPA